MEGAESGAAAPVGVPAWKDLAPSSEFVHGLLGVPLPAGVQYFFAAATGTDGATDGVVPVVSQEREAALAEATERHRYPRTHVEVLSDGQLAADLHAFLGRCVAAN